jgi:hypothetical protein
MTMTQQDNDMQTQAVLDLMEAEVVTVAAAVLGVRL